MSKQKEIQKFIVLLESLPTIEIRKLRRKFAGKSKGFSIPRAELKRLIKQNKSTKAIAQHFRVSPRTITRRIAKFNLKGIRPRGRKPKPKAPKKPKIKSQWISMRRYWNQLNKIYRIVNIKVPPKKWINPQTLVASNLKENPEGEFTTVGIYYLVEQSGVYLIYALRIRYAPVPIPFEEIYSWIYTNAYDIVLEHSPRTAFVVDVLALTFEKTINKPDKIEVRQ